MPPPTADANATLWRALPGGTWKKRACARTFFLAFLGQGADSMLLLLIGLAKTWHRSATRQLLERQRAPTPKRRHADRHGGTSSPRRPLRPMAPSTSCGVRHPLPLWPPLPQGRSAAKPRRCSPASPPPPLPTTRPTPLSWYPSPEPSAGQARRSVSAKIGENVLFLWTLEQSQRRRLSK